MIYKIRFENAANATAPAQRVFIKIKLDNDLDHRTFRLGSYGFGDYEAEIKEPKSFLQVRTFCHQQDVSIANRIPIIDKRHDIAPHNGICFIRRYFFFLLEEFFQLYRHD